MAVNDGLARLSVIAVAGLFFAGCGRHESSVSRATPREAVPVHVVRIESKSRMATEDAVGTVRAKLSAVIEAKVSGRIEAMLVTPGQAVNSGDLLAKLDAREIQAQLNQAQAVRQQAENDLRRFTTLLKENTVTQSEFDSVEAKFRVAAAAVTEAETMLDYTRITAPFSGVITHKFADVGDLATPGKPLLGLEDVKSLRLEADVPEALIANISMGAKVSVTVPPVATNITGVVSEIAPAADPQSRTFLVKCDLPSLPGLRTGQFGRMAVPVGEVTALRVPASAVVQRGQMEIVFVVKDAHAHLRLVKTGRRVGDEVELVSGIDAGEEVVADTDPRMVDGEPVSVVQ